MIVVKLCHSDISKRLVDEALISQNPYWEFPWDVVNAKKLVPPHVPRISEVGESSHFDKYRDGDKPMEGTTPGGCGGSTPGSSPGAMKKMASSSSMITGEFSYF